MRKLFGTYRLTIAFIFKFLLIYVLLVWLYSLYLGHYVLQTDPLTLWVGRAVSGIYHLLGLDVKTLPISGESGLKLIINGQYVARIIEGCTAASVIILFVSFVIAFGQKIKKSLLFAMLGGVLIFIFNLFRIVFLGYLLYAFPQYQDIAHRIVFPALIYGFVVVLWIIFIKKINDVPN